MRLAKIKEALSSLYDDIQEVPEAPAPEAAPVVEPPPAPEGQTAAEPKAAEAEEPAAPPGPRETDYKAKGYHLDVALPPGKVVAAAEILNLQNFLLEAVSVVHWIDEQQLEVVYDFNHFAELCRVVLRSRLDRSNPEVPTISHIYQGANWHERETHEFFGIVFTGHPNLAPLLLPEDAHFHPLRKDFKA